MIANENEGSCHSNGPETHRQCNLRCLINNAVIKNPLIEDSVIDAKASCCDHLWAMVSVPYLLNRLFLFGGQRYKIFDFGVNLRKATNTKDVYTIIPQL